MQVIQRMTPSSFVFFYMWQQFFTMSLLREFLVHRCFVYYGMCLETVAGARTFITIYKYKYIGGSYYLFGLSCSLLRII